MEWMDVKLSYFEEPMSEWENGWESDQKEKLCFSSDLELWKNIDLFKKYIFITDTITIF